MSIGLIQEPWVVNGQVRGLAGQSCKLLYDKSGVVPRAAIVLDRNLRHFPLTNHISRDLVATTIEVATPEGSKAVVFASAYFPGDSDEAPPLEVEQLYSFCRASNRPLVIGCDANAHHTAWGSTDINTRGESLFNYLLTTELGVANIGCKPTFVNAIRAEVLDLTLTSNSIADSIVNWRVSDEASLSDHLHIRFEFPGRVSLREQIYNPKGTNWNLFRALVASKMDWQFSHNVRTVHEIDLAANLLQETLISSYHGSTIQRKQGRSRRVPWWNENLAKCRSEVRKLFNKAKAGRIDWELYRASLGRYNKAIRKAKRSSWRSFCSSVDSLPEAARLHKVLAKGQTSTAGLLKKTDGTFTQCQTETMELLMSTHFPGSTQGSFVESLANNLTFPTASSKRLSGCIFDKDKVKWAIMSFSPYKSPGGDGILPALLQEGLDAILNQLIAIFRASYEWGHIPDPWRRVNVVFLPKNNKPLDLPKSYRPISLSSFLLKTMERLLEVHIRNNLLNTGRPLHHTQFAYVKGKSTEVALHNIVGKIEKAYTYKGIALCAFLDVEGAFDNTSYDAITRALTLRGIDLHTITWIKNMLMGRRITSSVDSVSVSVRAIKGCPQGGVLSPLLWSLVVDEILVLLAEADIPAIGYADDLALIISGKYEDTITNRMQVALNLVLGWCRDIGLSINPAKADIVAFTRRYKVALGPLFIDGTLVELSKEVKYLGVVLDKRLNWNSHLDKMFTKATQAFWACRRLIGRTWGLSPRIINWLYTMMVRPIVTYAAIVWWTKTTQTSTALKCEKLQRMVCLAITGAMRTCPTAAMEKIIGLTPLHLHIQEVAACCLLRINTTHRPPSNTIGHNSLLGEFPGLDICERSDLMTRELLFNRRFSTLIPCRNDFTPRSDPRTLLWYTDGSKSAHGVGAGVYGPNTKISVPLGIWPSVFQAEIYAIGLCALVILKKRMRGARICILTDSQAAIKVLSSWATKSKLVLECWHTLQKAAVHNSIMVCWIPSHTGDPGNDEADRLARLGSAAGYIGPEPSLDLSWAVAKGFIKAWIDRKSARLWLDRRGLRQSKKLITNCNWKQITNLSKPLIRLLTGFLSGHHTVKWHLHKMGLSSDNECRLCLEDEETTEHLLCECPALCSLRMEHLQERTIPPSTISSLPLRILVTFVERIDELLS